MTFQDQRQATEALQITSQNALINQGVIRGKTLTLTSSELQNYGKLQATDKRHIVANKAEGAINNHHLLEIPSLQLISSIILKPSCR